MARHLFRAASRPVDEKFGQSKGGDIVLTEAVFEQPEAAALLEGVTQEQFEATLKGSAAPQKLWRLRPTALRG